MPALVPWNKLPLERGDVPMAIISLPDATRRRAALIERGMPADFVHAFWPARDMRDVPDAELQSCSQYRDIKTRYARRPVSAELGCMFSHGAIIKWLSEQDEASLAVLFEDDVVPASLRSLEALKNLAEALLEPARSGAPFICHLGPRAEQWSSAFTRRVATSGSMIPGLGLMELVDRKAGLWRAHAYIISRGAAERYVDLMRRSGFLADDWRFITDQTRSRMLFVNPPLFTQDDAAGSTIDPGNTRVTLNSERDAGNDGGSRPLAESRHTFQIVGEAFKRFGRALLVRFCRVLPGRRL